MALEVFVSTHSRYNFCCTGGSKFQGITSAGVVSRFLRLYPSTHFFALLGSRSGISNVQVRNHQSVNNNNNNSNNNNNKKYNISLLLMLKPL